MKTGYWIDLQGQQFSDDKITWIQALPLGSYTHPLWGEINVTPERVKRFAQNVADNVREIDLDIDYDHKTHHGKAAGWIRAADARADGLWIGVEWTEMALQAIKAGEYRYFSPEFQDEWEHPKTGVKYTDVLFGGGLTNRPYLKDIMPINMSEIDGGEQVDELLKAMREKFGLSDDATEADILKAFDEAEVEETDDSDEETEDEVEETDEKVLTALSEKDQQFIKALAEDNPAVKALTELVTRQGKDINKLQATTKLSEASVKLADWQRGGSKAKFALPSAVTDAATKMLTEFSPAQTKAFSEFVDGILETGLVELGERGKLRPTEGGKSAAKTFSEKVAALMESGKLDYADAATKLSEDDPELFEAYSAELYAGEVKEDK